jgi:hypothetical protein
MGGPLRLASGEQILGARVYLCFLMENRHTKGFLTTRACSEAFVEPGPRIFPEDHISSCSQQEADVQCPGLLLVSKPE